MVQNIKHKNILFDIEFSDRVHSISHSLSRTHEGKTIGIEELIISRGEMRLKYGREMECR